MIAIEGYQIESKIGQGGMATVYLAKQISLNRPVALKVMSHVNIPGFSERFLREAKMIASLSHRHVITIYDIGVDQGQHYISMEYVTGGDLKQRISEGIALAKALNIVDAIAGALQAAHEKGIVHRDVKPANILFREDGTPLLTDFGVAKQADTSTRLTKTGAIVGTPAYLSPDHAHDIPLDGRADMYSLGIVFYEMLTGKRPYIGDSDINTIFKHIYEPLPVLPKEYAHLQPFLDMLLAKKREDRYQDMGAMRSALRELVSAKASKEPGSTKKPAVAKAVREPQTVVRPGTLTGTTGSIPRRIALATVVVALIAATAVYVMQSPNPVTGGVESLSVGDTSDLRASRLLNVQPVEPFNRSKRSEANVPVKVETVLPRQDTRGNMSLERSSRAIALVDLGNARLAERKVVTPLADNALYYFRMAQDLDPSNRDATNGLYQVASYYADLAQEQLRRKRYTAAKQYIDRGLRIYPDHPHLHALDRRLKIERTSRRVLRSIERFTDSVVDKIKQGTNRN